MDTTPRIPTHKEVEKIIDEIRSVEKKLTDFTIVLQPSERDALPRMLPGGEGPAAAVAHLARKHKIVADGHSVDSMENAFMHAERLKTLYREAYYIQKRIEDTILKAQGDAWTAAQKLCEELRKIAAENPRFATEFQPVDDFFNGGGQSRGAL
ncbi:MAG: hypothetical protein IPK82_32700 [Polyangiaceae bacterium]|nr:hypothetical protein [Polyangiaceae bacterium]